MHLLQICYICIISQDGVIKSRVAFKLWDWLNSSNFPALQPMMIFVWEGEQNSGSHFESGGIIIAVLLPRLCGQSSFTEFVD